MKTTVWGYPVGEVPTEVLEEIEAFEMEATRFLRDEVSPDVFRPFRLQFGVYGQRQPGIQMFRIKIPFGWLTPLQLHRIAEVVERYAGSGLAHLTTRQNIQTHFVKLEHCGLMMRQLAEVGLTTREACGNTVRNVTACPFAGVSPTEVMDVTPYALGVAQHFLRSPVCQNLPRKFKIAFEGCADQDHVATQIHDVGVTAVEHEGRVGFRVTVGGGLSSAPRIGHVLAECAAPEDLIPLCEAVVRVFDRHGQRKNRMKARLKFVIGKLGFPKFKALWQVEYDTLKASNGHYTLPVVEEQPSEVPVHPTVWSPETAPRPFARWYLYNVVPQRQPGFSIVMIKLHTGDITPAQLRVVADVCERYAHGNIRTTQQQNFVLRWIHDEDLPTVYQDLVAADLATPGAERVEDVIACPGTDTCGLSFTHSKALAREVEKLFTPGDPANDDLAHLRIKISGCHNSCAQHHLASIGFHGVSRKQGTHVAPMYEVHVGGTNERLATNIVKIPAKNVPAVVHTLIEFYRENRHDEERFEAFVHRVGTSRLRELLIPHTFLPSYKAAPEYYYDWEEDQEFEVKVTGLGECAGGAQEMMENYLTEADQLLYLAGLFASKKSQGALAVNKSFEAVVAASKALLVTEGLDPSVHSEVMTETETRFIRKGVLPAEFSDLAERMGNSGPKDPSPEFVQERLVLTKAYVEACRTVKPQLEARLKAEQASSAAGDDGRTVPPTPDAHFAIERFDLSGVGCPLNYVKTKLKLEEMEVGALLEVILDEGEPIRNVPASLLNDGHTIREQTKFDDHHYRLLVQKSA